MKGAHSLDKKKPRPATSVSTQSLESATGRVTTSPLADVHVIAQNPSDTSRSRRMRSESKVNKIVVASPGWSSHVLEVLGPRIKSDSQELERLLTPIVAPSSPAPIKRKSSRSISTFNAIDVSDDAKLPRKSAIRRSSTTTQIATSHLDSIAHTNGGNDSGDTVSRRKKSVESDSKTSNIRHSKTRSIISAEVATGALDPGSADDQKKQIRRRKKESSPKLSRDAATDVDSRDVVTDVDSRDVVIDVDSRRTHRSQAKAPEEAIVQSEEIEAKERIVQKCENVSHTSDTKNNKKTKKKKKTETKSSQRVSQPREVCQPCTYCGKTTCVRCCRTSKKRDCCDCPEEPCCVPEEPEECDHEEECCAHEEDACCTAECPRGRRGPRGPRGRTGGKGNTGAQGPCCPGATGAQGRSGSQGRSGVQGSSGATGAQGDRGPTGAQGNTGAQGDMGHTGAQGASGTQGEMGVTGAQGPCCPGATGAQGTTGTQGVAGGTGAQGSTGPGATGAQGRTGAQGGAGVTGTQGPTGSGATGAQGQTGGQGVAGATGGQGSGATGTQGSTGAQGNVGPAGTTGATGATGPCCPGGTGAQGATGAQGVSGVGGILGYAYFYHTGGQTVGIGTAGILAAADCVQFPTAAPNGVDSGITVGAANFRFDLVAGVYAIDWLVTSTPNTGAGSIFFALVNAVTPGTYATIAGVNYAAVNPAGAVSQQTTAAIILVVPTGGMNVALVNESGASVTSGAVPVPVPDGSATAVDASIRFLRIA
jgi:hypothetical protein